MIYVSELLCQRKLLHSKSFIALQSCLIFSFFFFDLNVSGDLYEKNFDFFQILCVAFNGGKKREKREVRWRREGGREKGKGRGKGKAKEEKQKIETERRNKNKKEKKKKIEKKLHVLVQYTFIKTKHIF